MPAVCTKSMNMRAMRDPSRRRQQQVALAALVLIGAAPLAPQPVRGEPASPSSESDEVLATFEGGKITRQELERVIAQKHHRERAVIAEPGGREAMLEKLVRYDLLALEAERRGYGGHVEVKVATRSAAADQMLLALYGVDRAKIPQAEIERAYEERKYEFGRPTMRRGTHIRVATETEAKALIAELRGKDREAFAKVSRAKNIDARTRDQGGELGYFDRDGKTESKRPTEVPLELVRATFELKRVGDVYPTPIPHPDGTFSALQLTGEMEAITKTIAELDPMLREALAVKMEELAVEKFYQELRAKTPIETHPELLMAIELPPAETPDMPEGFAAAPPDPRAPPVMMEPDGI